MTIPQPADLNYQTPHNDSDSSHLSTLSVCWYVWAGLTILGGFLALLYVGFGILMLTSPSMVHHTRPGELSANGLGWIFIIFGALAACFIWVISFLSFLTARSLKQRKRRTLCMVCAILACLNIPIGMTLGIFTLVVLSRPSLQQSFT